jgi:copper transport protein
MTPSVAVASTPLDEFLDQSSASTDTGELLQRIGLTGSLVGITASIGLLVYLAAVHTGRRREIASLIRVTAAAGAVVALGATVELAGVATVSDLDWVDALTDGSGSAPMMRLLAGLLVLLGLFDHAVPADPDHAGAVDDDTIMRWVPASASAFAMVGVVVGAASFWFDGHTVTEGPRVIHAGTNFVHVLAGGVWFGGIVGLAVVGVIRRGRSDSIAPLLIRFSGIASVALVLVVLAGSLMTLMIIDGIGDLTSTDWGRVLLVKTGFVVVVAAIGGYNHFVVVPALGRGADADATVARARWTVRVEAVLLLCVAVITVTLTTASTI